MRPLRCARIHEPTRDGGTPMIGLPAMIAAGIVVVVAQICRTAFWLAAGAALLALGVATALCVVWGLIGVLVWYVRGDPAVLKQGAELLGTAALPYLAIVLLALVYLTISAARHRRGRERRLARAGRTMRDGLHERDAAFSG